MSETYAVVKNGKVENLIVATDSFKVDGAILVKYDADITISPGYLYENGLFSAANDAIDNA